MALAAVARDCAKKKFIQFVGARTLFQETLARVFDSELHEAPVVFTDEEFHFLVAEQAGEAGIKLAAVPMDRKTAPAAAGLIAERFGNEEILQKPASNREIPADQTYSDRIRTARDAALVEKFVTFGITPTELATGYNEIGDELAKVAFKVGRFVEKPTLSHRRRYHSDCR